MAVGVVIDAARVRVAKHAVTAAFVLNGFAYASWLARVPAVRTELGLSNSGLGLLLLCLSASSVLALAAAGPLVTHLGTARTVLTGAVLVATGLVGLAGALTVGSTVLAAVFLLAVGAGTAPWDVAMNVEAADVERRSGRVIMPRFHAGFSLGTVAGAGLGAGCAALEVAVGVQLLVTAVLTLASVAPATPRFLPAGNGSAEPVGVAAPAGRTGGAWRHPRTVAIGIFVLAFALTEGVANDWLALAFVDGHDVSGWTGAVGFGVFVAAMTVGRLVGAPVVQRLGRVVALRGSAATALVGLLLVVFGGPLPVVFTGAALWGLGACLGFPLGMSAAADDPAHAASRVSVVASVGYTAFLAGPPVIGFLADVGGILRSLLVVGVALVVGFSLASSTRGPTPAPAATP